jgi:UDP-2,3-diacylglucosamine pyrophosphatase LpxH
MKREVEVVVISDVHLGTYGAKAKELLQYLNSVQPKKLILNGDFIDIWRFKKNYFPKSHHKVIERIVNMISSGTNVIYITGNHDEMLRKFVDFKISNFELTNKKILDLNGKEVWMFHGDVFDNLVHHSKWLAKLGGYGYDLLIMINSVINYLLEKTGQGKFSLSKRVKAGVKNAVKFISDFEKTAAGIAIEKGYDYVVCGHIHQPVMKKYSSNGKSVVYLNSGDWIENLTSLEYNNNEWTIYQYNPNDFKDRNTYEEYSDNININTDILSLINDVKGVAVN